MSIFQPVAICSTLLCALAHSVHADEISGPENFKAIVYSQTAAELFWQHSSTGGSASGYEITRNGVYLGLFDALSLFQDDLIAGEQYNYEITAQDGNGNRSAASTLTFTGGVIPGGSAPPKPGNLRADIYSATALELFWDRVSTDILRYEVNRNGVTLGTTDGTSYLVDDLMSGQSYQFEVQAIKGENTRSAVSSILVGEDVSVTSPQNVILNIYSTSAAELIWTNAASTDQGSTVEIYRDGDFIGTSYGTSFYDDARTVDTNSIYALTTVGSNGQRSEVIQLGQFETSILETGFGLAAENDYGKISVSGNTAVLPADREKIGEVGNSSGAVYLFTRDSEGQWEQTQKLVSDENADRFGLFAAIDGDTLAISQRDNADILPDVGSIRGVTVYTRDTSGQWVLSQRISAVTDTNAYRFGNTIAISGDTMMIQAITNFDGSNVFVYDRNNAGEWIQQQELMLDEEDNDLGSAIEIDGNTAILGNYRDATNGFISGAAWIYTRDETGTWTAHQQLQPDSNIDSEFVGTSVALEGETAVLAGEQSYKAYIFTRDDANSWTQTQTLDFNVPERVAYSAPGTSVGLDDGTLVVGVKAASELGLLTGAIYVYAQQDGIWNASTTLASSNGQSYGLLGKAVAIDDGIIVSSGFPSFMGDKPAISSVTGYAFEVKSPIAETRVE